MGIGGTLPTSRSDANGSDNAATGQTNATDAAPSTGGSAPSNNDTRSASASLGASGTLGGGGSSVKSELTDVNGDGLPDRVTHDGDKLLVAYNIGYGFLPAVPFGDAAIADGRSTTGGLGVSVGFNNGNYCFA